MAANQNLTQLPTRQTGSADPTSLFYAVTGGAIDTSLSLSVFVNNLGLTGVPTAPTAAVNTNTTQIASCAYVINQGYLTTATAASTYAPKASPTFTGTVVIPTVTLSGGTINSTSIGATTPSTGAFTTLSATGNVTFSGGTINGTSVGATTPSTGAFTTVNASGIVNVTNSTASTNSTTGAVTITGGLGVQSSANIGGALAVGTTFSVGHAATLAGGIVGVTDASNATAGNVGEYVVSQITSNTSWAPASTVIGNLTSISLTAGDWDVSGSVFWAAVAGSGTWTQLEAGTTTTSSTALPINIYLGQTGQSTAAAINVAYLVPTQRINVTTTTTVYLNGAATYTSGTMAYQCQLRARRVR